MQKIIIKNFGPISNAEIDIKKAVVLIGEQGSGKSTIIKLISSFMWLEKDFYRSSITQEESVFSSFFKKNVKEVLNYHRIESYFNENTNIEYQGLAYNFSFLNGELTYNETKEDFVFPQIIYIPAERNFISYVNNFKASDFIPWGLKDFIDDFRLATVNLKQPLKLPINNAEIVKGEFDILYLKENDTYNIKLSEASSGFQAVVPILLVSEYLQKKMEADNNNLDRNSHGQVMASLINQSNKENDIISKELSKIVAINNIKINNFLKKTSFVNIVEEPEQNLFPVSQMRLVKRLTEICNENADNKLIMSTHSPYVLATINNLILANKVGEKNPKEVANRVDKKLWLNSNDVFAGIVKDGTVEDMIDKDLNMIKVELLDSVSQIINEEFDYLFQYETDNNA
jgi:predicted ATPase